MSKYLNEQLYSECQLVTALNAYIFYGGEPIKIGSPEYERLVDFCGTRYGSAISIENNVYKYLGLNKLEFCPFSCSALKAILNLGIPVELSIHSKHYGFHSVLVISHNGDTVSDKDSSFEVLNASKHGRWIKWTVLSKLTTDKMQKWVIFNNSKRRA